ncbi:uncharacterized protein LACBIDRAFT_312983 [Laccaria bicolor S238N-H82]|uniref:Predicted protein n=1 Tax=Laccaria bicolor (strain S238N-H82 / ATCC MYA-4686) TaxID=486041 RepID=B0DX95_LACBS|nr:uncharacterized protein LACBIDRAFT_312983 [Laccaria bicolor S238N-H82]EDR00753.1 predicted protein [Laccaria bicolor S238N-H82]|eukprot:XP_001888545.1 predicted protein [Laccaria bicolor S238N-H82]
MWARSGWSLSLLLLGHVSSLTTLYQGWDKMEDWTLTLKKFRDNMAALAAQGVPETLGGDIDTRLFKSITGKLKHGKALASTTNIEAAALLIRAMWKGLWSDLNNKKDVFEFLREAKGGPSLTELEKMIKPPHRLNLPIHLAAFVSPIGLLTGVQLCGRDYDRFSIFLMWKALGNMQPLPLRLWSIEKLLWDAIFSVARGQETGHGALTTFLMLVPWDQLGDLPEHDRRWFEAKQKIEMKYLETLDNIDILEIPTLWPLKITTQESPILDPPLNPTSILASATTPSLMEGTALNDAQSHGNMVMCDPLAVINGSPTHKGTPIANLSHEGHLGDATPSAIGASAMSGPQTHEIMPIDNLDSGRHFGDAESNVAGASKLGDSQTPEDTHLDDLTSGVQLGSRESGSVRTADGHVGGKESDVVGGSQNYHNVQTADYQDGASDLSELSELSDEEDITKPTLSAGSAQPTTSRTLSHQASVKPKKRKTSTFVKGIGSTHDWPIDEAEMERMQARPPSPNLQLNESVKAKGLRAEDPEKTTPFVLSHQSPKGVESRVGYGRLNQREDNAVHNAIDL